MLAMLVADPGTLAARAERLGGGDRRARRPIVTAAGKIGGGSLPLLELEGPAVALDADPETLVRALRPRRAAGDRADPRWAACCSTRAR